MSNRRKTISLKKKILTSFGILISGSAIAISGMFIYANNSDEVNGTYSSIPKNKLINDYSSFRVNGELKPELAILDPLKEKVVGGVSEDYNEFWFESNVDKKYNFDEFFNIYYQIYNESFTLEVKYGSFSFYDEYVLAVNPKQFIEFTKWFIDNVSWGPDLLTLDSFRIVPGVEQNGNAITLGSHSTLHKESSEIKFFPDAFFGSMPIYSILSGSGNANDSLTYSTFSNPESLDKVNEFLSNIPLATSIKNAREGLINSSSYLGVTIPERLIGKEFLVMPSKNSKPNDLDKVKSLSDFIVIDSNISNQQFNDMIDRLKQSDSTVSSISKDNFKLMTVKDVSVVNDKVEALNVILEDKSIDNQNRFYQYTLKPGVSNDKNIISYNTFRDAVNNTIEHFYDFYDVHEFEKETLTVYTQSENGSNLKFFRNRIEAINTLKEFADYNNLDSVSKNRIQNYTLEEIKINRDSNNSAQKINFKLVSSDGETRWIIFDINDIQNDQSVREQFDQIKSAIGYNGSINPIAVTASSEDTTLVDENGNPIKGLAARKFQIYNEAYAGLFNAIVKKYPHLLKEKSGPHVVRKLNDKGYFEYSIEDGLYKGFSDQDRIGLPLLLSASIPNYEGISTDFLKYVATHEYGHHYTLEKGQAWDTPNNAVLIGGLSTRGGASDSSYYSAIALRNYLYARTNLDFDRINTSGIVSETGEFTRFKFIKSDGTIAVESYADVWGTNKQNDEVGNVIDNPERRFLQTFDGLKKAAELRNVSLGDLFIANSFDSDSGTLNPYIDGEAKVFVKEIDENSNTIFKAGSVKASNIAKYITDGMGNSLESVLEVDEQNNTISIKVVEWLNNDPKTKIITKVNLLNSDKTPAISVPLNEELTSDEVVEVNALVAEITKIFQQLIYTRYYESGWNNANTSLGGKAEVSLRTLSGEFSSPVYKRNLVYRNQSYEYDPNTNFLEQTNQGITRNTYHNLALSGDIFEEAMNIFKSSRESSQWGSIHESSGVGVRLAFVENSGNTHKVKSRYTTPYASDSEFLKSSYDANANILNNLKDFAERTPYGKFSYSLQTNLANYFGFNDKSILTNNPNAFVSSKLLSYVDSNGYLVAGIDYEDIFANNQSSKLQNVVINPFSRAYSGIIDNLFEAFNKRYVKEVKNNKTENKTKKALTFNSLEELFAFASIDYKKAVKVINEDKSVSYNWDINYVKTKFDFDIFKNGLLSTKNENNAKKIETILSSEQNIANELMYRFRHSNLFLSVVDFNPATDLTSHEAIFSKEYGIEILEPQFIEGYVENKELIDEKTKYKFDVETLQQAIADYITKVTEDPKYLVNADTWDLYTFIGNNIFFKDLGVGNITYDSVVMTSFTNGTPTVDVTQYNATRIEPLLNDKFTDYIYSLAETLTRDYVQTTYITNTNNFGNLPSFLNGINEATTGLDYVVDATKLSFWNDRLLDHAKTNRAIYDALISSKLDDYYNNELVIKIFTEYNAKYLEYKAEWERLKEEIAKFEKEHEGQSYLRDPKYKELNNLKDEYAFKMVDIIGEKFEKTQAVRDEIIKDFKNPEIFSGQKKSSVESRESSYFGNFISKSNGFFKDRWQKEKIGMELYDENLNEVIDETIRLKDFNGEKITSRPKAFFVSQLMNYGVGTRNIAGVFRNKDYDAVAMYGFIENKYAEKIKKIKFTDVNTKEVKYVNVNINSTNNIFYLQKQNDASSKVTLHDLGYSSWITDYAIMAKYRDALLLPKHSYYMEFVDENNEVVSQLNLGDIKSLSENGKDSSQAPIYITNELNKDKEKTGKVVISVNHQFNI